MMIAAKVFLLEQRHTQPSAFALALERRGYAVMTEHTASVALKRALSLQPDVVVVNAASFNISGSRLCRQFRTALDATPVLLIADQRHAPDPHCGASAILWLPFTPRKLHNALVRLLPADEADCLCAGPIKLHLAQRRIICRSRQERVTPKQAKLLEMFLRAPGQLLTRRAIIKRVWDTDYMGDTRTLDVHISWLRRIIEPNPSRPRYLVTLRGQGYRLDISPGDPRPNPVRSDIEAHG